MAKNIEAEGGELVLQNNNGDTVIIPKNKRQQALKMLEQNNHAGIDELASSLPYMEDYAQDGSLIPDQTNLSADPPDDGTIDSGEPTSQETLSEFQKRIDEGTTDELSKEDILKLQGEELSVHPYSISGKPPEIQKNVMAYTRHLIDKDPERFSQEDVGYDFKLNLSNPYTKKLNESIRTGTTYQGDTDEEMFTLEPGRDLTKAKWSKSSRPVSVTESMFKENPEFYKGFLNPTQYQERYSYLLGDKTNAQTNALSYGGLIKAAKGLFLGKNKDKNVQVQRKQEAASLEQLESMPTGLESYGELEVPEYKAETPTLEEIQPSIKEFGDQPVDIPEGITLKTSEAQQQLKKWGKDIASWEQTSLDPVTGDYTKDYTGESPNPKFHGCLGSGCRVPIGKMKSYYDIRKEAGILGVYTGEDEKGTGYANIDSWELAGIAEATGIGKNLMQPTHSLKELGYNYSKFGESMKKARSEFAKNFSKLPVGSILTAGNAEGVYTDEGEKTMVHLSDGTKKEIKQKVRPRHTMRVWGIDSDTDEYLIYDGRGKGYLERVPNNEEAINKFLNDKRIMYATSLEEQGDWSLDKLNKVRKHNRMMQAKK